MRGAVFDRVLVGERVAMARTKLLATLWPRKWPALPVEAVMATTIAKTKTNTNAFSAPFRDGDNPERSDRDAHQIGTIGTSWGENDDALARSDGRR